MDQEKRDEDEAAELAALQQWEENRRKLPLEDWQRCVGKGWWPLVERCFNAVTAAGGTVQQVKEKFGGLRFYYGILDADPETYAAVDAVIRRAEDESCQTCEVCGNPGEIIGPGWLKALCPEHRKK